MTRKMRLQEQIMVAAGTSSGISLATARMAAGRGARLVLAARSGNVLLRIARELGEPGRAGLRRYGGALFNFGSFALKGVMAFLLRKGRRP